jgi:hypothetical protein
LKDGITLMDTGIPWEGKKLIYLFDFFSYGGKCKPARMPGGEDFEGWGDGIGTI